MPPTTVPLSTIAHERSVPGANMRRAMNSSTSRRVYDAGAEVKDVSYPLRVSCELEQVVHVSKVRMDVERAYLWLGNECSLGQF